jgi:diacylglycerol kinase family enzyme
MFTSTRSLPNRRRRFMACIALCALIALVLWTCAFIVYSRGLVLAFGLLAGIGVATITALGWWAFTTRRTWKRWLNVALAVFVICVVGLVMAIFSLVYAFGVLLVAVVAVVYAAACRAAGVDTVAWHQPDFVRRDGGPPSRPWLLVNPRSGDGKAVRHGLVEAATGRGLTVRVLQPGEDVVRLAREAVANGADAIGVAGGDGSLGLVAAVAVEYAIPFVCIPAGTRNHFARDLGLDREAPLEALDAYAGSERLIDVGVVGERLFLNNVSVGAYATLVHQSEYRANKLGTARIVLPAALRGEEASPTRLSYQDSAGRRHTDTVVLLIGNNEYDLRPPFDVGSRPRLDGGVLQMSALLPTTGAALVAALTGVTTVRRNRRTTLLQWTATQFSVGASAPQLPVAVDGEAALMSAPLAFKVMPQALRVLVPNFAAPAFRSAGAFRLRTVHQLWELCRGSMR